MTRQIIIDVDAGSDDAVAILLLLALEPDSDFKVLGITCTHGNAKVDDVCANVLRTLETIDRQDVPVFRGAESPLLQIDNPNVVPSLFHGSDGFGDNNFPPPTSKVQRENAIVALNRLISQNEDVSLLCLGPLTNIALAFRTFGDLAHKVAFLYIMGGNSQAVGNTSSSAEFNFFMDPEAAHIVLSSSRPVTLLPWETCTEPCLSTDWRFNVLGRIPSPQMELLNAVEAKLYKGCDIWNPCDAFVAAAIVDQNVVATSRRVHITVELHGLYTRGQAVIDHVKIKKPNAVIIDSINFNVLKEMLIKMASFKL